MSGILRCNAGGTYLQKKRGRMLRHLMASSYVALPEDSYFPRPFFFNSLSVFVLNLRVSPLYEVA